jgi:hypothetical protein
MEKTQNLVQSVKGFENGQVTSFFRDNKSEHHFMPHLGMFANEFAIA